MGAVASRRVLLAGLGTAGLTACAPTLQRNAPTTAALSARPRFQAAPLVPLKLGADRITRITVCTRPFRAAGPRFDVETVGAKRVVHNYGHGGSGWSLAWGSAEVATRRVLEGGTGPVAVIGCGAIGLTTALTLVRAGAATTIYAAERTPDTRSARATGAWSPDSRIAAADKIDAGFPALWEAMTRVSYRAYQTYLGLPGEPVAWYDRYSILDGDADVPSGPDDVRFFARRLDLWPRFRDLAPEEHPFAAARVRHGTWMQFNVAALAERLTREFLQEGGRIVQRTFHAPAELASLSEPVIVNCTGYGARALWKDDSIVPIRGQIGWLAPQPDARWGLYYRNVSVLPRPDGVVVQVYAGDMDGYGNADETPDPAETEAALARVRPLFRAA
jgi:glycine/D-amino acid oxidase-like deaminating enzyme